MSTNQSIEEDLRVGFVKNIKFHNHDPKNKDTCWRWQGSKYPNGLPRLRHKGKSYGAHRVSYQIYFQGLTPKDRVTQKCGNKDCCSPYHLTVNQFCPKGHRFDESNTQLVGKYRARRCKKCHADYVRRRRRSRNEADSREVKES